jgi:hypothetical protein
MAISSGAGPHFAYLSVGGSQFPIENGTVTQQRTKESSTFHVAIPLSYPGAEATLATTDGSDATITVISRGQSGTLLTGEADNATFDLIGRTIRVTGRDKAHKLHGKKTSEKWINKTGSEIVQDLAGRAGLKVQIEGEGIQAGKLLEQDWVRLSDNVSFAYVISKLAELDGARWWVDKTGTFHYQSNNNQSGSYTLNIRDANGQVSADFMQLHVHRNIQAGKPIEVKVNSWHPKDKKVYKGEKSLGGVGEKQEYHYTLPNLKQDHVDKYAESKAAEHGRHELMISATVVGDPSIDVAMALVLNGSGYFDQSYEMDCITHSFGMHGHKMTITARSRKGGPS